jgi:hypothetical protein
MALSNGNLHFILGRRAQAEHVSVPFWSAPGFAIPLFRASDYSNAVYVQRVDEAHKIIGFEMFEGAQNLVPLEATCRASVGDQEVFAVVDPFSVAHAGNRATLSRIVKSWVTKIDTPLLRMSFARFCGELRLAEGAAEEAVKSKTSELRSEEQAIRWFLDAVVLTELLTTLASSSRRDQNGGRGNVLETAWAVVHLDSNRRIQIDVPRSLLQRENKGVTNYRKRLANLLRLVHTATGREVDVKGIAEKRSSWPASETVGLVTESSLSEKVSHFLSEITQCPRQEKRIALMIDAIISDRAAALVILENYSDSATLARKALTHLRDILNNSASDEDIEEKLKLAVSAIITAAYPLQKGRLLLDLARVLGKYPSLASVIRNRTIRSTSHNVMSVREAILNELD